MAVFIERACCPDIHTKESMETALASFDVNAVAEAWIQANADAKVDKTSVDNYLRECLTELLASASCDDDQLLRLVQFGLDLTLKGQEMEKELCSKTIAVVLLGDIFDCSTVDRCERLFDFVERHTSAWKTKYLYQARNHLLRMCNDLLRRLSRSVDVGFCGRILVFLAHSLPLTERSGLNLTSQFNADNVTKYDEDCKVVPESADKSKPHEASDESGKSLNDAGNVEMPGVEEEAQDSSHLMPIDFNMYRRFWQLQEIFASPNGIYDKLRFNAFKQNANAVLTALSSHKLDDSSSNKRSASLADNFVVVEDESSSSRDGLSGKQIYFAKYLTSQRLLQLQLNDANFRRYVFVQFLILFQYLRSEVKMRDAKKFKLTDDQSFWVLETINKVYELLRETPPEGKKFAETIKQILKREESWNAWKNLGCSDFTEGQRNKMALVQKSRSKKRNFAEDEIDLANPELTRLWKICPDNFEACKGVERQFQPTLEAFFEEAIEQNVPEAGIEESYKLVNNENYIWRAFRLLTREKEQFFEIRDINRATGTSQPGTSMAVAASNLTTFLQHQMDDIAQKMPKFAQKSAAKPQEETPPEVKAETPEDEAATTLTNQHVAALAALLGPQWTKLAAVLSYSPEEIAKLGKTSEAAEVACRALLNEWRKQQEGVQQLQELLEEAELFNEDVASILRSNFDNESPSSMKLLKVVSEANGDAEGDGPTPAKRIKAEAQTAATVASDLPTLES